MSIVLQREASSGANEIIVRDRGMGISKKPSDTNDHIIFDAFYSTSPNRNREPSYHYSRTFGVPYSGAGMGLLKSKVYLNFHEASIKAYENSTLQDGTGTEIRLLFKGSVQNYV